MKNFKVNFISIVFLLTLTVCCKRKDKTLVIEKNNVEETIIDDNNLNCIIEKDSILIIDFTKEIIKDMIEKNYSSLLNKMEKPIEVKKSIDNMSKKFPNYLEAIFSLDIDDEDGETIGNIKNINNAKIIYEKQTENCLEVLVGLDSGLLLKIKKIKGKLKIYKYDMAG